jgi:hypothetical protein
MTLEGCSEIYEPASGITAIDKWSFVTMWLITEKLKRKIFRPKNGKLIYKQISYLGLE